jgi:hypothetical protein
MVENACEEAFPEALVQFAILKGRRSKDVIDS